MDAMSSSFFSKKLASPHIIVSRPLSTQQSPSQSLYTSSFRAEDKHEASATATSETNPRTSNIQLPPLTFSSLTGPKTKTEPTLTRIFDKFEDIINDYVDPPLQPAVDPNIVLSGNFAPVNELPPTECEVIQGSLPSCLDGAYIRNGPNPQYQPRGPYHLFDGDGMLHSIRISRGRATLCGRYVKTYKYTRERCLGSPIVPSIFSSFISLPAFLARITNPRRASVLPTLVWPCSETVFTLLLSLIYHMLYA